MDVIFPSDLLSVDLVSHFTQLVSVYILWKQEKITGFLIFLGSIEIDLLHELKVNFPITEKPVNWLAFICLYINTII